MIDTGRIPLRVVHHSRHDPRDRAGGVETFARRLGEIFEQVETTWTGHRHVPALARDGAIVICDNDTALDWPRDLPLIAFQHGVAWQKVRATGAVTDARLAFRQWRAAARARTVWVACAHWIADAFAPLHPFAPQHVVYHHVDTRKFDGRLDNVGSRLVLHDARTVHKGSRVVEQLAAALPAWQFEPLACAPDAVADRLRRAAAFIHLSRYEGNSIVCVEAMAMDLPCILTDVGLARDAMAGHVQLDVGLIGATLAHGDTAHTAREVGRLLDVMREHPPSPRHFVQAHASVETARARWRHVLADFAMRCGRRLDLGCDAAPTARTGS
jgi:glycosyltransferase involved in cell wall biosynthesis